MEIDNSWKALLAPGSARTYFNFHKPLRFDANTKNFNASNGMFMAELSRWVYCDADIANRVTVTHYLQAAELVERYYHNETGTQLTLLESDDSSSQRFAVLVFRGTDEPRDWLTNLTAIPVKWEGEGLVHLGFLNAFNKIKQDVSKELERLECPVFYTGHSLGGALATLAAALHRPHGLYTFGSPRVGTQKFADSLGGLPVYRVVNNGDVVTRLPTSKGLFGFRHAGERIELNVGAGQTRPGNGGLSDFLEVMNAIRGLDFDAINIPVPDYFSAHAPVNYVAALYQGLNRQE